MFAEYITSSSENMRRFYQDFYLDGSHALSVSSKVLDKLPDDPSTPVGREFLKQAIPLVKTHSEIADATELDTYLGVRTIAKSLGHEAEYQMSNMVLSKFTHATALSILIPVVPSAITPICNAGLSLGFDNVMKTMQWLAEYVSSRDQA